MRLTKVTQNGFTRQKSIKALLDNGVKLGVIVARDNNRAVYFVNDKPLKSTGAACAQFMRYHAEFATMYKHVYKNPGINP